MDRLSNMLSGLKNAAMAKKDFIEIPHTKVLEEVAKVLKDHKFLSNVKVFKIEDKKFKGLHLDLAKNDEGFVLTDVKRVSKPGRRMYVNSQDLKISRGGFGVSVISTSRGIMDSTTAKKKKLGGEFLCEVY